jgi:hypothetical protein
MKKNVMYIACINKFVDASANILQVEVPEGFILSDKAIYRLDEGHILYGYDPDHISPVYGLIWKYLKGVKLPFEIKKFSKPSVRQTDWRITISISKYADRYSKWAGSYLPTLSQLFF